ncbi:hypothetical protein LTR85_012252 [Meristemomyces frigidus]|nr:hypothetical protein LTR85_012252 [Meristemomyces frigidus]
MVYVCRAEPTTQARRYMAIHGYTIRSLKDDANYKRKAGEMEAEDIREALKRHKQEQIAGFDQVDWQAHYIEWIVADDITLRKATITLHKDLLTYRNLVNTPALPTSFNTARSWVIAAYHQNKTTIRQSLANAQLPDHA